MIEYAMERLYTDPDRRVAAIWAFRGGVGRCAVRFPASGLPPTIEQARAMIAAFAAEDG